MKIYVSIPIAGKVYNAQKFKANKIAEELRKKGHEVVTPFDVVPSPETPYNEAMGKCMAELLGCDAVFLCEGWRKSKGCVAEYHVALVYGKQIESEQARLL